MNKKVIGPIILSLLFFAYGAEAADEVSAEMLIKEEQKIIVGLFEIWKHVDGTWQDTDHDGKRDKPYEIENRLVSAKLHEPIPVKIIEEYDQIHQQIIPIVAANDNNGVNKALFNSDPDGFNAIINEEIGLSVEAKTYISFQELVLKHRPYEYKEASNSEGEVEFQLYSWPLISLKRPWQEKEVEGYGFYLPALVRYFGIPKPIDLEAISIYNASPVNTDSLQKAEVVFQNNGAKKELVTAQYSACGNIIKEEVIEIEGGEKTTRKFLWKSPDIPGKYELAAQLIPLSGEKNISNNKTIMTIKVEKQGQEFEESMVKAANWEEVYSWTVYHSDSYMDKSGNIIDSSWTEVINESVPYNETLSCRTMIDTKQGIITNKLSPREHDEESRGSWEIIPWARSKRINPNEVTRAGYGFEVKVNTIYWTDWETKVPSAASPHGGVYPGAERVTAYFFSTSGRQVETVEMVPTAGKIGDKNITWELPLQKHKLSDGSYRWQRKHYTDLKNADGNYQVRIIVSACGKNDLKLQQDKQVIIYGDSYDDLYVKAKEHTDQ